MSLPFELECFVERTKAGKNWRCVRNDQRWCLKRFMLKGMDGILVLEDKSCEEEKKMVFPRSLLWVVLDAYVIKRCFKRSFPCLLIVFGCSPSYASLEHLVKLFWLSSHILLLPGWSFSCSWMFFYFVSLFHRWWCCKSYGGFSNGNWRGGSLLC